MRTSLLAVGMVLCLPAALSGQTASTTSQRWTFITRVLVTGSSDHSTPSGFQVYSAIAMEAAVRRQLARSWSAELSLRTESREVDSLGGSGTKERLGSLEFLPVNVLVRFQIPLGSANVYAGAGANLTVAWEKSGALDSTDMKANIGPALDLGMELNLSSAALLNFNVSWNALTADVRNGNARLAKIRIDPLALGIGLGFRF